MLRYSEKWPISTLNLCHTQIPLMLFRVVGTGSLVLPTVHFLVTNGLQIMPTGFNKLSRRHIKLYRSKCTARLFDAILSYYWSCAAIKCCLPTCNLNGVNENLIIFLWLLLQIYWIILLFDRCAILLSKSRRSHANQCTFEYVSSEGHTNLQGNAKKEVDVVQLKGRDEKRA